MVLWVFRRDHPRIRGEHRSTPCFFRRLSGSSPHTRGALLAEDDPGLARRIIPAYAGSTQHWPARRTQSPDHPRIRGEHQSTSRISRHSPGSSPHTRGAPRSHACAISRRRIIPAYAGSTFIKYGIVPSSEGSSPHTRGARRASGDPCQGHGIIPAYAGSTRFPEPLADPSADHPRIRGEHKSGSCVLLVDEGSSPHTRGARMGRVHDPRRRRIIPAYAGSTDGHEAHTGVVQGSSPHTRGAPDRPARVSACGGIIPAYAGSTAALAAKPRWQGDHPRIRGEHRLASLLRVKPRGSSPHTRGAPD